MTQKIIPFSSIKIRKEWLEKLLGGLPPVSVKNKEWLTLLIDDGRNTLAIEGEFDNRLDFKAIILGNKHYEKNSAIKTANFFEAAINFYELAHKQFQEKEFEIKKSEILTIQAILYRNNLHREFSQKPGTWALIDREIPHANFKPLVPSKIVPWIEKLLWYVHNLKVEPTRKAAIFHVFFEHIHPLPGGNGRTGRILLNWVLLAHGLPSIAIKGIKKNDREIYYNALVEADEKIEEVLTGKITLNKFPLTCCQKLENLIEKYLAESFDIFICEKFFENHEPIKIGEIAKLLDKSEKALQVACSQKKYISILKNGVRVSHPDLFFPPQ